MEIKVKYEVSESYRQDTFDLESDLGLTIKEWTDMSEDERNELLMERAENNAPYWMVNKYEEE